MAGRTDLVAGMKSILGKDNFVYGSFERRPDSLVYGNYAEAPGETLYADDGRVIRIDHYIVRLVSDHKDFVLEDTIETLFESLDFCFVKITDEYIKAEKANCTEWEVVFLGER